MHVRQSEPFAEWFAKLRDRRAQSVIVQRLLRVGRGLLGDTRPVGGGVSEMRIAYGPGYRLYFIQRDKEVIVLLVGGDKGSQARDIARARVLAAQWSDDDASQDDPV